jgi:hypothetical protein
MTLSTEERPGINRQKASRSTGPKTAEGKARSRGNALKHGLRAELLALPNEDPDALADREREWSDHYRPRNPGEAYLVRTAVRSTLQLDRCDLYLTATLSGQVRAADARWETDRFNDVDRMIDLFDIDHDPAVRGLRANADGCDWLIENWEHLRDTLVARGFWTANDLTLSRHLGGSFFAAGKLVQQPGYSGQYPPVVDTPERAELVAQALAEVQVHLDRLIPRAERLRTTLDAPDRAEAAQRAVMIRDPKDAQLFIRYQSAAHSTFFRSWTALEKVMKAREKAGETCENGRAPNEPNGDDVFVVNEFIIRDYRNPIEEEEAPPAGPEPAEPAAIPAAPAVEVAVEAVREEIGTISGVVEPRIEPIPTS